jgi:hypothetical protein
LWFRNIKLARTVVVRHVDPSARERPDALFVAPDAFFLDRRVQLATLTARDRIPAAYDRCGQAKSTIEKLLIYQG